MLYVLIFVEFRSRMVSSMAVPSGLRMVKSATVSHRGAARVTDGLSRPKTSRKAIRMRKMAMSTMRLITMVQSIIVKDMSENTM